MSVDTQGIAFVNFSERPPETCAICRAEDMTEGLAHKVSDTVAHRFHTDCVTPWLNAHKTCPTCRMQITHINDSPIVQTFDPAEALFDATRTGSLVTIELLLTGNYTLSGEDVITAAAIAHQYGISHAHILHRLVNDPRYSVQILILNSLRNIAPDSADDILQASLDQFTKAACAVAAATVAIVVGYTYFTSHHAEEQA